MRNNFVRSEHFLHGLSNWHMARGWEFPVNLGVNKMQKLASFSKELQRGNALIQEPSPLQVCEHGKPHGIPWRNKPALAWDYYAHGCWFIHLTYNSAFDYQQGSADCGVRGAQGDPGLNYSRSSKEAR